MNDSNVKVLLSFVGGFVIGGALMFKMATDRFNKQLDEIVGGYEDAIDDYEGKLTELEFQTSLLSPVEKDLIVRNESKSFLNSLEKPEIVDIVKKYNPQAFKDIEVNDVAMDEEEQYNSKEAANESESDSIFWQEAHNNGVEEISATEYFNNDVNFEQLSLTYYEMDNILVDEKNEVVPNPESILGFTALRDTADKNIFYVRNFDKKIDLEVIRTDESYYESLVGTIGGHHSVTAKNAQPTTRKKRTPKKEA